MATSESYTNKVSEKIENTDWHDVVCGEGWHELAENFSRRERKYM